jgi:nitrous oxide reductase accessory protein NosL
MQRTTSRKALVAAALAALLAGCGQDREAEEPMPVEETVFGDQVEQIDRTREQVQEMEGRMQDLNAELDKAEGNAREQNGEDTSGN